jgi:TP901 family phage tail tape measure protein
MATKNVSVKLSANVAPYKKAMAEASSATSKFESDSGRDFKQLGSKMESVGKKMTVGVTLPIIAAGAGAVKMSMDFDASMSKITALVGIGADEVSGMKDAVLELAGSTATAPQELADALFVLTSAGLRGDDALSALEASAKASAAGLGQTNDIARAVAGAMNAYGPGVLDAARATDILTATARAGNFETSQLAGALGRVLPFAKQAGASFEDVGGAVALLTRTNGDAAQSITNVTALLGGFVVPTAEATTVLGELGMTAQDVRDSIEANGLPATLQTLMDKLGGNKEALGKLVGGKEAASAAFSILEADAQTLADTFGVVTDSVGMTDEAFGVMAETSQNTLKQAWIDMQVALIQVGEIIGPLVADIAGGISTVVDAFSKLPDGAQIAVVAFAGVIAAVGPLLTLGGKILISFDAISLGLTKMKAAMIGHPILTFAVVAAAVGTALYFMADKGEAAKKEIEGLADEMNAAGDAAGGLAVYLMTTVEGNEALLTAMTETGETIQTMTVAAMAGGEAWDVMVDSLLDGADAAGVNALDMIELRKSIQGLDDTTAAATSRQKDLTEVQEISAGVADTSGRAAGYLTSMLKAQASASGDLSVGTEEMSAEIVAAGDAADATAARMSTYFDAIDAANDTYDKSVEAVEEWADGINSAAEAGGNSFGTFESTSSDNLEEWAASLNASTAAENAWKDNLVTVYNRAEAAVAGSGEEIVASLSTMGVDGAGKTQALVDATDEDFGNMATSMALSAAAGQRDVAAELDKLPGHMTIALAMAEIERSRAMIEANTAARSDAREMGSDISGGIGLGISSSAYKIDNALVAALKAANVAGRYYANIQSPSRLFAEEIGEPLADGVAEGILSSGHKISNSMVDAIDSAKEDALDATQDMVDAVGDALDGFWAGIDGRRSLEDLNQSVDEAGADKIESTTKLAEAQLALATAEASGNAEDIADARRDVARATDDLERATERLENANYRLTKATVDMIYQDEEARASWMETAAQAGLTAMEIDGLVAAYDRLATARADQFEQDNAIKAEAAAANAVRGRFGTIVNQGAIGQAELDMIAGLDPAAQLKAMQVAIDRFNSYVAGRSSGGPMAAGRLYEVGEGNVAEMFMSGGRQYMIPGNDGQMIGGGDLKAAQFQQPYTPNGSGAESVDWDAVAQRMAREYARTLQREVRTA